MKQITLVSCVRSRKLFMLFTYVPHASRHPIRHGRRCKREVVHLTARAERAEAHRDNRRIGCITVPCAKGLSIIGEPHRPLRVACVQHQPQVLYTRLGVGVIGTAGQPRTRVRCNAGSTVGHIIENKRRGIFIKRHQRHMVRRPHLESERYSRRKPQQQRQLW